MIKLLISFFAVLLMMTSFNEIVAQPKPVGIIFRQVPVYRSQEDSINIEKVRMLLTKAYNGDYSSKPTSQKLADSLMDVLGTLSKNGIIRNRKLYTSQLGTVSRNGFTPYTTFDSIHLKDKSSVT